MYTYIKLYNNFLVFEYLMKVENIINSRRNNIVNFIHCKSIAHSQNRS